MLNKRYQSKQCELYRVPVCIAGYIVIGHDRIDNVMEWCRINDIMVNILDLIEIDTVSNVGCTVLW